MDKQSFESPIVIKEAHLFYMYNHAVGGEIVSGYRIGLAVAESPKSPWMKYGEKPILCPESSGSWDDNSVAIGHVLKINNTDYMWYMGQQRTEGSYYIWRIGLSIANRNKDPYIKYEDNPVIRPDVNKSVKSGQVSEIAILFWNGLFHEWYSGYPERNILTASIGYAWSKDGVYWQDRPKDPVIKPGSKSIWNKDRVSEPHVLLDDTTIFLFFTGAIYRDNKERVETLGLAYLEIKFKNIINYNVNP